jgi:hypothetical protein
MMATMDPWNILSPPLANRHGAACVESAVVSPGQFTSKKGPLKRGDQSILMASQKLTNCGVAAIVLAASTYLSTPHCSTIARLAVGAFCLASGYFAFLRKHQYCYHTGPGK